jgi:S-adenosylmethionine:tRNA ribosyltransferase-isomerase
MMALDRLVQLKIEDFWYELPENKIAKFPLQTRDESKLLVFNGIDIQVDHFKNLATYLPNNSTLVFNNTKVVNARLFFRKETGALIEIFCLEPSTLFPDIQIAIFL